MQHGLRAGKQRDRLARLHLPHVPRDQRQLPGWYVEVPHDLSHAEPAQRLDLVLGDPAEAEPVRHAIHVAQEPGEAVDQRAVEIEDDEGVGCGHGGVMPWRELRSLDPSWPGLTRPAAVRLALHRST